MSTDLSELLKEATKEVHEQAENTPFMRNFQKGQVSLQEFKVLQQHCLGMGIPHQIEGTKGGRMGPVQVRSVGT